MKTMLQSASMWVIFALCCFSLVNVLFVDAKSIVEYERMQKRAVSRQHRRVQKRSTNTTGFRYNTNAAARMLLYHL
jgi:hypothetical protein